MPPIPPSPPAAPSPLAAPIPPTPPHLAWFIDTDQPWGDMQLVPLTSTLGQYFGTDKGLLVVHVTKRDALKLQDGDVILNIGGRDPGSPPHAMRILHSYNPGETVKLEIMRKGKPVKLDVKMPDASQPEGGGISEIYRDFQFGPAFLHLGFE
jgi:S1-C subfamily serine protease